MDKPLTCGMDNLDAVRLGEVCLVAASPKQKCGDLIDRGLILRRLLEEKGYGIIKLSRASRPSHGGNHE